MTTSWRCLPGSSESRHLPYGLFTFHIGQHYIGFGSSCRWPVRMCHWVSCVSIQRPILDHSNYVSIAGVSTQMRLSGSGQEGAVISHRCFSLRQIDGPIARPQHSCSAQCRGACSESQQLIKLHRTLETAIGIACAVFSHDLYQLQVDVDTHLEEQTSNSSPSR